MSRNLPSFDEAMRVVDQHRDTFDNRVQELADEMMEAPEHYPGSEYGLGPDPSEWAVEEAAEEHARIEWVVLYDSLLEQLERLDGAPCYRGITLPEHVDPAALDRVGRFWAWDIWNASAQEGTPGYQRHPHMVTFQGRVALQHLDWEETVLNNMVFGMQETEVTFRPDTPIWLDGYWLRSYNAPMFSWEEKTPDNMTVVGAWRRT